MTGLAELQVFLGTSFRSDDKKCDSQLSKKKGQAGLAGLEKNYCDEANDGELILMDDDSLMKMDETCSFNRYEDFQFSCGGGTI